MLAVCVGAVASFGFSGAMPRVAHASDVRRLVAPRLLIEDGFSMDKLRQEVEKRANSGDVLEFAPGLGRFAAMQRLGPHHTTTPREVVEYVINKLREGDATEAFKFTCIPVTKRGCHKSSTDWTRRMSWEKARVIGDAPSGIALESAEFNQMLQSSYAPLMKTTSYRFIGDRTAWQQKKGHQKMTAVKEYVVELKTNREEHFLVKMRLVYDWLLYCHLVATVELFAMSSQSAFPGAEDIALDI